MALGESVSTVVAVEEGSGTLDSMKVRVDQSICTGCELCVGMSPKLFKMSDALSAQAIREEVPRELVEECRDTADACPVLAIEVSGV